MFAVDFKDGIATHDSRFFGSRALFGRQAHDDAVAGINADIADAHLDRFRSRIRSRNHEFLRDDLDGKRFAATMDFKFHVSAEAYADLFAKIIPTLSRLAVDGRNRIARLDSRNFCRRILGHESDNEVLGVGFLNTDHVKENQENKRKGDIHKRSRKRDCGTRPYRLAQKIIFSKFAFFDAIRVFTGHGHVTAKGNCRNTVFRLPSFKAKKFLAKTDRERIDPNLVPLGDNKMTEFMNGYKETQGQKAKNKHQKIVQYARYHAANLVKKRRPQF